MMVNMFSVLLATVVLHVAPGGRDSAEGTEDRPLATPYGARDAVRRIRAANGGRLPKGGVEIVFAPGEYRLSDPLRLDSRDSGSPDACVIWRAGQRGSVVFSGASVPERWRKVAEPEVLGTLPANAPGEVYEADIPGEWQLPTFYGGSVFSFIGKKVDAQLSIFKNGRRLALSRWPNGEEWSSIVETVGGESQTHHDGPCSTSGVFRVSSVRVDRWAREPDLWIHGKWAFEWSDSRVPLKVVDAATRTVQVDRGSAWEGFRKGNYLYVFNSLAEMDLPDEVAVDRRRRRVYIRTVDGVPDLKIAASDGLVEARNVTDVRFEGFIFEYSRTTAFRMTDCDRVTLAASAIRHGSSWGVDIQSGTGSHVMGCDLSDLGEGGVCVRAGDRSRMTRGDVVVENCNIGHYGRIISNYMPGIELDGVGNSALHNLIHHTDHQAIQFHGNDLRIAYNVIHDTCLRNNDAGAVYCCGQKGGWTDLRGTVIEYNLIHMTGRQPKPVNTEAIYLDDSASGITVRGNILNRANVGIALAGGNFVTLERNIICGMTDAGYAVSSRGTDSFAKGIANMGRDSRLYKGLVEAMKNPAYAASYPEARRILDVPDPVYAHYALYNVISNNVVTSGEIAFNNKYASADESNRFGGNVFVREPCFVDVGQLDFSLQASSPVRRIVGGDSRFKEMGLYKSRYRFSDPVKFSPDVTRVGGGVESR